jgi:micrococcal nuclease
MKKLALSLITTLLFSTSASANPVDAQVTNISDGDTLKVISQGQNVTIRLACIDAPESTQVGGAESAQRLQQLIPIGSNVKLIPVARDQYERVVAVVFGQDSQGGNLNVNLQMVYEGQAIVYREYLSYCPGSKQDLVNAEAFAKNMSRGFWNQTNCPPAEFRKGNCSATTQPPRRQCDPSYPDICIPINSPDLNCGDVPYTNIRVVGNDPHGFDGDGNGVGCQG